MCAWGHLSVLFKLYVIGKATKNTYLLFKMFLVGPARLFNISHKDQEYADFSIEVLLLVEKMVAI